MEIKRLLAINVPIKNCNLNCQYCYIATLDKKKMGPAQFAYKPKHVGKCLSQERLGGTCVINLTGGGETLLPKEMPEYIYELLSQGHYLEVVTNGTLTKRFEEIALFPSEFLSRLEFKFSFHYAELKRRGWLDRFFSNVKMMEKCGCSYTVELMPYDEIIEEIPRIIECCKNHLGAKCQITVGRNDLTKRKDLLTSLSREEYEKIWNVFESTMFDFKLKIFDRKITEFCYAGAWTLYIDLGTGAAKPCYGQISNQNIFENPDSSIKFEPVGKHCRQPYCYNGHAFLTMGVVPELETPTYADIRNRKKTDGTEWLQHNLMQAFSQKLVWANEELSQGQKVVYEMLYPLRLVKNVVYGRKEIREKILKKK